MGGVHFFCLPTNEKVESFSRRVEVQVRSSPRYYLPYSHFLLSSIYSLQLILHILCALQFYQYNYVSPNTTTEMRLLITALSLLASSTWAFVPISPMSHRQTVLFSEAAAATMADSGKPPAHAEADSNVNDVEIPTVLPSDVGMDYVPLATMLATGQLAEADQVSCFVIFCVLLILYAIRR